MGLFNEASGGVSLRRSLRIDGASINEFDFNIHGTDGTLSHDAPVTFGVQAFTLDS